MKRGGFLKRRTPLKKKSLSESSTAKDTIQDTVREIVIIRDGGCILRGKFGHVCSAYTKAGDLILQADHLIERSNSATYADTRLIVCVCKGLHGWKHFKKSNHDQYNEWIRQVLPAERIALWERCEADSWRPVRTSAYDWQLALAALKQELRALQSAA